MSNYNIYPYLSACLVCLTDFSHLYRDCSSSYVVCRVCGERNIPLMFCTNTDMQDMCLAIKLIFFDWCYALILICSWLMQNLCSALILICSWLMFSLNEYSAQCESEPPRLTDLLYNVVQNFVSQDRVTAGYQPRLISKS